MGHYTDTSGAPVHPCTPYLPTVLSYHVWDSVALAPLSSVGLFYFYLIAAASQLHLFCRHIFSFLARFQMKILHSHTFPFPIAPASVSICFLATLMSCLVDFLLACFWLQYFGRKGWHQSRCAWSLFSYFVLYLDARAYLYDHRVVSVLCCNYNLLSPAVLIGLQISPMLHTLPRFLSTQNIKIHRRARRTGKELL